jgi:hypothetical protein
MQIHTFLTSTRDGGEWSASRTGRFTPGKNWIGGWVGPTAGLNAVTKRDNPFPVLSCPVLPCPARNRIPVVLPVA